MRDGVAWLHACRTRLLEAWRSARIRGDLDAASYRDRTHESLRLLRRHLSPGAKILDVGCGAGVQAEAMALEGYEVVACDQSQAMALLAHARLPGRAAVAGAEQLPFADRSFDAILMLEVIGYSSARWKVLASARRVLREGGILVISTASQRLMLDAISARLSRWPELAYRGLALRQQGSMGQQRAEVQTETYAYSDAREFDAMLARHGFERLEAAAINFGRLRFMGKRLWPEAMDIALSRALSWLARRWRLLQRGARIYVGCYRKR